MKDHFAENLRYLRKRSELSQSALAAELNYSRSNIASYEFGGSEPNIKRLTEIAQYFNVSLDDLMGRNIEKAMYDRRLKEKPIKAENSMATEQVKIFTNMLQEELLEVKAVKDGSNQFVNFKKKNWQLDTDKNLMLLLGEYEKMNDLVDFIISKIETELDKLEQKK